MSEPPEPVPRHDRPETWRRCLWPGCQRRVDPATRNHRCPEHRAAHEANADRMIERMGRRGADMAGGRT